MPFLHGSAPKPAQLFPQGQQRLHIVVDRIGTQLDLILTSFRRMLEEELLSDQLLAI